MAKFILRYTRCIVMYNVFYVYIVLEMTLLHNNNCKCLEEQMLFIAFQLTLWTFEELPLTSKLRES